MDVGVEVGVDEAGDKEGAMVGFSVGAPVGLGLSSDVGALLGGPVNKISEGGCVGTTVSNPMTGIVAPAAAKLAANSVFDLAV